MSYPPEQVQPITGCNFLPHPTQKTLGILRIDTLQGQSSLFLVTRKNLLLLSEALAKHAQELDAVQ